MAETFKRSAVTVPKILVFCTVCRWQQKGFCGEFPSLKRWKLALVCGVLVRGWPPHASHYADDH